MQVAFTADCGVFLLLFESMADSDEDTNSYVVLGKAIGTVLPDEPLKRPLSVNELPVKDNQGRVRFHGAFTGGFSAGYFNSVGSKEGWAPTTFVSSRQNRNKKIVLAAEDFMDDEDFSEHGIAPRKIVTSDQFKSEEGATKRKNLANSLLSTNSFLHNVDGALLDFIVPEKISVGVKLLRKMGWKEGQGVGPRQRKRRKELKPNNNKLYGCAAAPSDSDSEISDDNSLQHVEFAPKDTCRISFHVKDNLHGLGYSGINIKAALPSTHVSLFSEPSKYSITGIKKNKRGIKGIAFGVGAMEEDDEDIYAADSLSKYDQSIGFADEEDNLHGWTAPGRNKPGPAPPNTYVGKILEGFTLSSKPLTVKVVYPPPQIPKGYQPYHMFEKLPLNIQQPSETLEPRSTILNALSRSIIIGETKTTGSVFDLISKSSLKNLPKFDSSRMPNSSYEKNNNNNDNNNNDNDHNNQSEADKPTQPSNHKEKTEKIVKDASITAESSSQTNLALKVKPFKIQSSQPLQTSSALQWDFQPFSQDPLKQERYNKYLLLLKHGKVDPYSLVCDTNMTEWEHEIEKEEFSKAAKLYKPLAAAMASRFTKAKFQDDAVSVELPEDVTAKKKDLSNAVEMKLYGKLTREIFDWHPDKLLCRRFNVPDPYPGSGIINVPKTKHDKYSIFDFLASPPATEEKNRSQQDDPAKGSDNTAKNTSDKTTTSAPKRTSIFSHLMAEKPASTPSSSGNPEKEPVLTSTPQPTVEEGERPPMDLFKAIFADSSSNSEEEEEEKSERKKDEHKEEEKKKNEDVNENGKNRAKEDESREKELKPTLPSETFQAPNLERKTENAESIKEKISPSHSSKDSDSTGNEAASVEVYGPALPPKFTTKSPSLSDKQLDPLDKKLFGFLKKSSSKRHKHKSKHTSKKSEKDKHRQRKDKKQKKKKKKKKKHSSSKTYDSSSSSSSSAD